MPTETCLYICLFLTGISINCTVSKDLICSTIIPIPKKSNGTAADSENYRGIALSSILGKILDNVILEKYHDRICTSGLQFGFKRISSTDMWKRNSVVLYETSNFDASKAFDRVQYYKLFRLLIKRGLPAFVVRLVSLIYWTCYTCVVVWLIASEYFVAHNGVKQGGVASPVLFCIYIDDLLARLAQSGVGCFIGFNFVGVLGYADDIVLIAPTPSAMRQLLLICDTYAVAYDIMFNANKSKMYFGAQNRRSLHNAMKECIFEIRGNQILRVDSFSHLGHIITSNLDDSEDILQKSLFYRPSKHFLCFFKQTVRLRLNF